MPERGVSKALDCQLPAAAGPANDNGCLWCGASLGGSHQHDDPREALRGALGALRRDDHFSAQLLIRSALKTLSTRSQRGSRARAARGRAG